MTQTDYMTEAIANRVRESGHETPFTPSEVEFPSNDAERRAILENADPSAGGKVPIVIAPSGMLTGGNSPRYLVEFAARFQSAMVLLTGYQAKLMTMVELSAQLYFGIPGTI